MKPTQFVLPATLACVLIGSSIGVASAQSVRGFAIETPQGVEQDAMIDRVILKVASSASDSRQRVSIEATLAKLSAEVGTTLTYVRTLGGGEWLVSIPQPLNRRSMSMLTGLLSAPEMGLEFAHPDYPVYGELTPNDPLFQTQWHLNPITTENVAGANLPGAWDLTRGAGETVAVLDTGYRPHVDLVTNILPGGYDFLSEGDLDETPGRDNDPLDPFGGNVGGTGCNPTCPDNAQAPWHGTHVAGIVAARGNNQIGVAGAAFEARVLPVRVLGRKGGYTSDIADAIRWTAGLAVPGFEALPQPRARIMNMSLGFRQATSCPPALSQALTAAFNRGVSIIVSAGNNAGNSASFSLANCNPAEVFVVAAVGRQGQLAQYSNRGTTVDIAAPGGFATNGAEILSTYNASNHLPGADNYAGLNGTSMAAPQVAAVAALIRSLRPNFGPNDIYQTLRNSARAFPHSSCNGVCGAGLLDATRALQNLGTIQNQPIRPGHTGTWFDPQTSGQGFFVNLDAAINYAFVGWYTFDANGQTGDAAQRWYTAQAANIAFGNQNLALTVYRNNGGVLNGPPATSAVPIGTAELSFQSCSTGRLTYNVVVDGSTKQGTISLSRLTPDTHCEQSVTTTSLAQHGINPTLNGAWYNPTHSGQGFQFDFTPRPAGKLAFASWYTYDANGTPGPAGQRWYTIQGDFSGTSTRVNAVPIYRTTGGRLDSATPPATTVPVGTADIEFFSCTSASVTYRFSDGTSGVIPLRRLVSVPGCIN